MTASDCSDVIRSLKKLPNTNVLPRFHDIGECIMSSSIDGEWVRFCDVEDLFLGKFKKENHE